MAKRASTMVVFKDTKNEWRWHIKASNGRILAEGGEGYSEKRKLEHALDVIANLFKNPSLLKIKRVEEWRAE